ncbi:hypothetical protein A5N15_08395 [Rothia kristinae]|uniref:Uncharacterized protein n=1 Tax=Rothia kristinae TaxID=37923 RepID=A0A657ITW3_9MICC|nr:hypothetical protein A5N15_08395 [Rothia kristinae]
MRLHRAAASAIITAESTKCTPTIQGFRRSHTEKPPTTACTGIPANSRIASQNRSRYSVRRRITARTVSTATIPRSPVRVRLPNSMKPWIPISGTLFQESSVQRGQVGQPSPDWVRRTSPPVITSSRFASTDARAVPRTHPVTVSGVSTRQRRAGAESEGVRVWGCVLLVLKRTPRVLVVG